MSDKENRASITSLESLRKARAENSREMQRLRGRFSRELAVMKESLKPRGILAEVCRYVKIYRSFFE